MTTAIVPSRTSSQSYTVTLHDDGSTTCTCVAGSFHKPCWHSRVLRAMATEELARRQAEEAAALDAEIDRMTDTIRWHGHEMPAAAFASLQRRYWAARERRAELTGMPLVTI